MVYTRAVLYYPPGVEHNFTVYNIMVIHIFVREENIDHEVYFNKIEN